MQQTFLSSMSDFGFNDKVGHGVTAVGVPCELSTLSAREHQILGLACEGLSMREIGTRIYSDETLVRMCLKGIAAKMGLQSSEALIFHAQQHEFFKAPAVYVGCI